MNPELERLVCHRWVRLVVRWILGGSFVYASFHKIVDPAGFAKIVYGYYLFPDYSINLIAIIVPFLEFFPGLALIFGIYLRSAAIIINSMLLSFIVILSINIARGHEFDCGCFSFGEAGHTSAAVQLLVRDIFLFVLGVHVILIETYIPWKSADSCANRLLKNNARL
ncbi:MAG: MauE/DoxX family redox-associated membrane protein [Thermodesulfobacteriota bacterium]|nr:MauE/DoxX family redox-associated membrane protein [Thermodesulfobacteriota bacterium]